MRTAVNESFREPLANHAGTFANALGVLILFSFFNTNLKYLTHFLLSRSHRASLQSNHPAGHRVIRAAPHQDNQALSRRRSHRVSPRANPQADHLDSRACCPLRLRLYPVGPAVSHPRCHPYPARLRRRVCRRACLPCLPQSRQSHQVSPP